mmetsp:Transcript_26225/g.34013  ORF Transcript_26225/g.34013 Transcript_26225/m.34013 type:complete len:759 (-) Transcript_26225:76-2352(-)
MKRVPSNPSSIGSISRSQQSEELQQVQDGKNVSGVPLRKQLLESPLSNYQKGSVKNSLAICAEVQAFFQNLPDFSPSGSGIGASAYWQENPGRYISRINPQTTLDPHNPQIRLDILKMIVDYLQSENLFTSAMVVMDEADMKTMEIQGRPAALKKLFKACIGGEWAECHSLLTKSLQLNRSAQKRLLYQVYKQEYLELIDRQEFQKAFAFLNKRLKQMETRKGSLSPPASPPSGLRSSGTKIIENDGGNAQEFKELCYLLTCKAVQDAPGFRKWGGIHHSREKLAHELSAAIEVEEALHLDQPQMPEGRLVSLLQQAVAYQMEFSRYHPRLMPQVNSLCQDYTSIVVPNSLRHTLVPDDIEGYSSGSQRKGEPSGPRRVGALRRSRLKSGSGGIKSLTFVGQEGRWIAAGLAKGKMVIWDSSPQEETEDESFAEGKRSEKLHGPAATCQGKSRHRIWDVATNKEGSILVSGNADGSLGLWKLQGSEINRDEGMAGSTAKLTGFSNVAQAHTSDVYTVHLPNPGRHVATGGNDRVVQLFDLEDLGSGESAKPLRAFTDHQAGISQVSSNPYGNLIVSGSRDGTINFWDMMSGVSVKNISLKIGAITSVQISQNGMYLLGSFRHGPIRLWDLRMDKPLQRFKGAHNSSGSFIRASFGLQDKIVIGGSDDGQCWVWDLKSGRSLECLSGHCGTVYQGIHHPAQHLLATCGEDSTVRTWAWQDPLARPHTHDQGLMAADTPTGSISDIWALKSKLKRRTLSI